MPTWPANLPQWVLADGYREEPPELLAETGMDAGPPATRRRFTAGVTTLGCRVPLTSAEKLALDAFFKDELKSGARPFEMLHPASGESVNCRMRRPVYSTRGAIFLADFELLVLP